MDVKDRSRAVVFTNPNVVWLTILQGFATYVSRNAELMRSKFVNHAEKQLIIVRELGFRFGDPAND
jgi:hypothetical protein